MPEAWFIDGYNLLYDLTSGKRKNPISRRQLFDRLAGFASTGDRRVVVVLDGTGPAEELVADRTERFEIVYSQKVSADAYIERSVCERKGMPGTVVVTRDTAISRMARGSGARVFEPREFMEILFAGEKDQDGVLFKERVKSHGFNRPFERKFKDRP